MVSNASCDESEDVGPLCRVAPVAPNRPQRFVSATSGSSKGKAGLPRPKLGGNAVNKFY
jgi:hypothetical protein